MRIELWIPGQPLGHFSAEEMTSIRGDGTGPIVAVIDEQGGCAIMQPIDPQTGEDWASEADAIAFAERYLGIGVPAEEPTTPEI
jgi:hypothetical protein